MYIFYVYPVHLYIISNVKTTLFITLIITKCLYIFIVYYVVYKILYDSFYKIDMK